MVDKEEILKYLTESGNIDLAYVQEQMEMKKREEILQNHKYSIWYSERYYIHSVTSLTEKADVFEKVFKPKTV